MDLTAADEHHTQSGLWQESWPRTEQSTSLAASAFSAAVAASAGLMPSTAVVCCRASSRRVSPQVLMPVAAVCGSRSCVSWQDLGRVLIERIFKPWMDSLV